MGMLYNPQTMRVEYVPDYMQRPQQQPSQGLLWVSGEVGAKSWVVQPNNTVLLMDSESEKFYIKSCDASGMPSIKTYEYKEVSVQPQKALQSALTSNNDNYPTREEFDDLKAKFEEYLQKQGVKCQKKAVKKEDDRNEPLI